MQITNGRLEAKEKLLSKNDFQAIAQELNVEPGLAVKAGDKPVAAMQIVDVTTPVVTINTQDGTVQSEKVAQPGDAIMTRLNQDGSVKLGETGELDQWAVDAELVETLYNDLGEANEYGVVVGGNNEVLYINLPNGGSIVPPWGGEQEISSGVLQYSITTDEVYLNEGDAFDKTFEIKRPVQEVSSESEYKLDEFNLG